MAITFICEWCGQIATDPDISEIDSGTTLMCSCGAENVVDLSKSEERTARYHAFELMSLLPRFAFRVVLDHCMDPVEDWGIAAITALSKAKAWLEDVDQL